MSTTFNSPLIVLVIILCIAFGVIFLLLYHISSLKTHYLLKSENEQRRIREEERNVAQKIAKEDLNQWKGQEFEESRIQTLEALRIEFTAHLEQWKSEHEQRIRQDAIQKSQAVTVGKVTEHLIPYFPEFIYNPKDARFIGSPIDLIIFDGLTDGEVKRVIFAEVKTGSSTLSTRERRIKNAICAGRVEWVELRASTQIPKAITGN